MRHLSLFALLLATAVPALAADPGSEGQASAEAPAERAEAPPRLDPRFERRERAERPLVVEQRDRYERPDRFERPVAVESEPPPQPAPRAERRQRWASPPPPPPSAGEAVARPERVRDGVAGWRWREREAERRRRTDEVPPSPPSPVLGERIPGPRIVNPPVGVQGDRDQRLGDRQMGDRLRDRIAAEGWRREWRQDRRYDWRRHRDRDRNRFRLGIYIDPFGWNYHRWQPGWNIYPRFYSSRYWIHDPWHYRLPPVPSRYRWVRYWDDALLVDLRTGRVVDVIHNFFW